MEIFNRKIIKDQLQNNNFTRVRNNHEILGIDPCDKFEPIPNMSIDWDICKIHTDVYLENYEDSDLTRMMALEIALGKKLVEWGEDKKIAIMGNFATIPISICVGTIQEKLLYRSCEGEFYVLDEDQYEECPEIVNKCKLIDEVPGYYVYEK